MKDSNLITYGKGILEGDHIFYIPTTTTTEIEELKNTEFKVLSVNGAIGLGEVSEDGVSTSPGHGDPEAVRNQAGAPVIHSRGEYEPSVSFNLMQTAGDIDVDRVIYGKENVIGTKENYTINKNVNNQSRGVFVIDTQLDNGGLERTIYPNASIQLSDDVVDNYTEVRLYPVTLTPSVDVKGNASYTIKSAKVEG